MFTVLWKMTEAYEELYQAETVVCERGTDQLRVRLYPGPVGHIRNVSGGSDLATGTVFVMNESGKTVATYRMGFAEPPAAFAYPFGTGCTP